MGDDASAEHKLGEEPEHWKHVHNGAAETVEISSPELSIDIPNICELPLTSLNWEDVKLPVDIVLFTVEDDEFLSCFAHLKKPERSYHITVGFVYFGFMEDDWGHKIETALMRCSKGHDGPGGALSAAKDAILLLRPKALISVGACRGLNSKKVKLGDIVVSSKLITPAFQIPPGRNMNKVIRNIADGWKPPLKNANGYKPKVHLGALLSISEANKDIISRYPEAIGVEEEAGGFWTAAHDFNIELLIVKGIKGFENSSHSSSVNWEKIACVMAASVVANILSQATIFQDWPHFNAATSPCSAASTACTAKS
ncbi:unnamed protein product [Pocillopora meandrina]|uniref:Nucleoside phosphorylase domain-containing protein n=1 Tax=Pocillopora meandrina TaxID=46732 RepID=A0AAU9XTV3_9CNID|nr:unnamed protein product [Pocillopora meandrina]